MAIDTRNLKPSELVRLLNSTPLGTVTSAPTMSRQMNEAGLRIGDGRHVDLVRYVAWLAIRRRLPRAAPLTYEEKKARTMERSRQQTAAAQNIGPLPDVADMERRRAACAGFRFFCETYFPKAFYRAWSDDHLRVIAKIERAVLRGGLFAFAMPRGSGKTTLARLAGLWAILTGARAYVCLIGGSQERALDLMSPIRKEILGNIRLRADFPEAVYPLWMLRNNARKQIGQHIDGEATYTTWAADKLVFPTVTGDTLPPSLRAADIEQSLASGSIITVTSLDSNIRGQQHAKMDGQIVRPSLVILDDPQTRESARSPTQTKYRLELLNGDVLGMAGPGEKIAAFLTCTKTYDGDLADQILDLEKNPEWQGECTKMVYSFPTNTKPWEEYAQVRAASLRAGRGIKDATEFYREHRAEMDAGSAVAWPDRFNKDELSALQHAMNLKLRDEEAFRAEYQNEPAAEQMAENILTPDDVAARFNGRRRGEAPLACSTVTMFIDVHDKALFYSVVAWQENFTGFVIDYGTFPDQKRPWFTLDRAAHTLCRAFPGTGTDAAIQAGLERLVSECLGRKWPRTGGGVLRIEKCLVDMGYKAGLVAAVKHKVGGAAMVLSKGVGIRAGARPMSTYRRHPGEVYGHNWYLPNVRGTQEFPHVAVDVNWWKTFVHARLSVAPGDPSALTLFGQSAGDHRLFAEHIAGSETWTLTHGHGRDVQEWKLKPTRPDNHWLDCLVGCAVAASMCGVALEGMDKKKFKERSRERRRLSDIQKGRRG